MIAVVNFIKYLKQKKQQPYRSSSINLKRKKFSFYENRNMAQNKIRTLGENDTIDLFPPMDTDAIAITPNAILQDQIP